MPETPFFKTAMGREFFDRNMPTLIKELQRLNTNIEAFVNEIKIPPQTSHGTVGVPSPSSPEDPREDT